MKHPMPTAPKSLRILRALNAGRRLTVKTALLQCGCFCLSQECGRLRRLGWDIVSEWVKTRHGERVKQYSRGW